MKIDLHVHSRYSELPPKWFTRILGARECYTEPETIYRLAKAQGMTHVTITDHNRIDGALLLREQHPDDVLTGLEANVYFPEDRCYFHLLVWGLDEQEFAEIERLRRNVYDLRAYLHERNLAHAVAHATFGISRKLSASHVERMLLLFNTFEGLNSGRTAAENEGWMRVLAGLTPGTIEELRRRYRIEPMGERPWHKGLTGGSDDHAGLFVARAYTSSEATTMPALLDALRSGRDTTPQGQSCHYPTIVFTVAKIGYEYTRERGMGSDRSALRRAGQRLFDAPPVTDGEPPHEPAVATADGIEHAFSQVIALGDRALDRSAQAAGGAPSLRNVARLVRSLPAWLGAGAAALPFLVTMRHLYRDRKLLDTLAARWGRRASAPGPALVFVDTPAGGRAPALGECRRLAPGLAPDATVVTSLTGEETATNEGRVVNLPAIAQARLPGSHQAVALPSLLGSLDALCKLNPSAVYVLTPGPLGLLGLLASGLLNVPCVGIPHPALRPVLLDVQGARTRRMVQRYVHWFYAHAEAPAPRRLAPQWVRYR